MEKSITACPQCKKPVEAKDYMNTFIVGALESILPRINCKCGYVGFPLVFTIKDYEKWIKE